MPVSHFVESEIFDRLKKNKWEKNEIEVSGRGSLAVQSFGSVWRWLWKKQSPEVHSPERENSLCVETVMMIIIVLGLGGSRHPIELFLIAAHGLLVLHSLDGNQELSPGVVVKIFGELWLLCGVAKGSRGQECQKTGPLGSK